MDSETIFINRVALAKQGVKLDSPEAGLLAGECPMGADRGRPASLGHDNIHVNATFYE